MVTYYSNILWTVWIFALIECNVDEINALLWIKTPTGLIILIIINGSLWYRSVSAARTAESSPPENNTAIRESLTTLTSCPIALPISVLEHTSLFFTASCKSSKSLTASGVDSVFARITAESEGTWGIDELSKQNGTCSLSSDVLMWRLVANFLSSFWASITKKSSVSERKREREVSNKKCTFN